jgi:hypothetical protein
MVRRTNLTAALIRIAGAALAGFGLDLAIDPVA